MRFPLTIVSTALTLTALLSGCSPTETSSNTSPSSSAAPSSGWDSSWNNGDGSDASAQTDWENQTGDAWDEFTNGYSTGFGDGCAALFDNSPDGYLYNGNTRYEVSDCENLEDDPTSTSTDIPTDVPDMPEDAGRELGTEAGCNALFDNEGIDELYWGNDTYTVADCS